MLDKLTHETFADLVDETFAVHGEWGSLDLILVECSKFPHHDKNRREPFSLVFRGPLEPALPQSIYNLNNETLRSLDIFLVPIGPDKGGMQYQAVFD